MHPIGFTNFRENLGDQPQEHVGLWQKKIIGDGYVPLQTQPNLLMAKQEVWIVGAFATNIFKTFAHSFRMCGMMAQGLLPCWPPCLSVWLLFGAVLDGPRHMGYPCAHSMTNLLHANISLALWSRTLEIFHTYLTTKRWVFFRRRLTKLLWRVVSSKYWGSNCKKHDNSTPKTVFFPPT